MSTFGKAISTILMVGRRRGSTRIYTSEEGDTVEQVQRFIVQYICSDDQQKWWALLEYILQRFQGAAKLVCALRTGSIQEKRIKTLRKKTVHFKGSEGGANKPEGEFQPLQGMQQVGTDFKCQKSRKQTLPTEIYNSLCIQYTLQNASIQIL